MDFKRVVSVYSETESLRETASRCNISTGKARKILVTCGAYDSPIFRQISKLHTEGKNIKEISEIVKKSTQCVVSYVPYSRGERTGESQTENAKRIRRCRNKKLSESEGGYDR